ncbi:MAG TPA: SDR family oxidoreductase [Planctomycetota bacterium]|nr:SDR family oxidoreductase [Planctomycetota bacterium]
MHRFTGKRILITGGSQGIGRACAIGFAREGGDVAITYSRDDAAAEACRGAVAAVGSTPRLHKADLGDPAAVDALWADELAGGGCDVLVLNAAFQKKATIDDTDLALLERTFRVNVAGNFQLAKHFIAARRSTAKPGAIVIHSSNQGEFVNPTGFAYSLTKAALNQMTRHLALATARDGIRVNCIALGWFDTDGERRFYSAEQIRAQAERGIPIGRAGDPAEAADLALFLASDASSYMTGGSVRCDGGYALAPDSST